MHDDNITKEYETTREICSRFGLSESWLTKNRVYAGAEAIPYVMVGRKVIYRIDTVRDWLSAREQRSTSEKRAS